MREVRRQAFFSPQNLKLLFLCSQLLSGFSLPKLPSLYATQQRWGKAGANCNAWTRTKAERDCIHSLYNWVRSQMQLSSEVVHILLWEPHSTKNAGRFTRATTLASTMWERHSVMVQVLHHRGGYLHMKELRDSRNTNIFSAVS